jgi:hypothetical protein
MKQLINSLLATALLAATSISANAAVRPQSKTIIVESPAQVPGLAQNGAEAMYLYDTNDGRAVLYIEATGGRALSTIDVTDPANIQMIGQTPLAAVSAFDFVEEVGDNAVLIRYRNGSGVALLSLRQIKHPTIIEQPAFAQAGVSETLGQTGLLLTSAEVPAHALNVAQTFAVVDTTNPSRPGLLASVSAVKERLSNEDTGTLFLLNNDGVTVVRQLPVEEEHQMELDQQRGN